MNTFRAFIAIEIPGDLQSKLEQESKRLQSLVNLRIIRWAPAHNIHITLKFLGDVPTSEIDKITRMLQIEASRVAAFSASIGGFWAFSLRSENLA